MPAAPPWREPSPRLGANEAEVRGAPAVPKSTSERATRRRRPFRAATSIKVALEQCFFDSCRQAVSWDLRTARRRRDATGGTAGFTRSGSAYAARGYVLVANDRRRRAVRQATNTDSERGRNVWKEKSFGSWDSTSARGRTRELRDLLARLLLRDRSDDHGPPEGVVRREGGRSFAIGRPSGDVHRRIDAHPFDFGCDGRSRRLSESCVSRLRHRVRRLCLQMVAATRLFNGLPSPRLISGRTLMGQTARRRARR